MAVRTYNPEEDDEPQMAPAVSADSDVDVPAVEDPAVAPMPVATVPDLLERRRRVREMVDKQAAEKFAQANPFMPSGWQPPTQERTYQQAEQAVGEVERNRAMQERAATIQARREQIAAQRQAKQQQILQQKTKNAGLEAQMRGTGQRFYTDPFGNIQPVIDPETKKPLYTPGEWQIGKDAEGRPTKTRRGIHGEAETKRPVIKAGADPLDEHLYADFGDGESLPYMTIAEGLKHPDLTISKLAKTALEQREKAQFQETVAPVAAELDAANLAVQEAEAKRAQLGEELNQLIANPPQFDPKIADETEGGFPGIGAQPTKRALVARQQLDAHDAQIQSLYEQQRQIDEALKPKSGALRATLETAQAKKRTIEAQAKVAAYARSEAVLQGRLTDGTSKNPEQDRKTLASVQQARAAFENGLKQAQAQAASTAAPAPVTAAEPPATSGTLANTSKMLARGAVAEGAGAMVEGGARLFGQSPIRRGVEAVQDKMTEMVQGFPLTAEQRASRAAERGQAMEQMGAAPLDRAAQVAAQRTAQFRQKFREALPVDEAFAKSLGGQIAQGLGQAAGTLPMAVGGSAALALASVGQLYDEAFQDAKQSGTDDATAHSAALKYLPAATLDFLSNKLIVGKLLKPMVGKTTVGQVLKDIGATVAGEGGTEGAQQAYLNTIAKWIEKYDPSRPFTKEVLDSALVGAVVGGGITAGGAGAKAAFGKPEEGGPATTADVAPTEPPAGTAPAAEAPPTDVPPAPAAPITMTDAEKVDRIAKVAEEAANMTPEQQAQAEVALIAELGGEVAPAAEPAPATPPADAAPETPPPAPTETPVAPSQPEVVAAEAAPEAVAAPEAKKGMPQWARDEMVSRGLDPARQLNDIDVQQPSIREAVQNDPTLTPEQKERLLRSGSPRAVAETPPSTTPVAESETASALGNASPELMSPEQAAASEYKLPRGRGADILPSMDMMADGKTAVSSRVGDNLDHAVAVATAARERKPLSAAAVDTYGVKLPDGYVLEGDKYVFRGDGNDATPVPIGPRDAAVSTGTGVATAKEEAMMTEWKKQIAEETKPKQSLADLPPEEPEAASRKSNVIERTARKTTNPETLKAALEQSAGLPFEGRIAIEVASNPHTDAATFETAINNAEARKTAPDSYFENLRQRRAELRQQQGLDAPAIAEPTRAVTEAPAAREAVAPRTAVLSEKEAQQGLIMGMTWDELKARQQGASSQGKPLPPVNAAKMKATIEREAAKFKNTQSAAMVDKVGAILPEGYILEGDSYVYKPGSEAVAPKAEAAPKAEPPLITPEERARLVQYDTRPSETVQRMEAEEKAYQERPRKQTAAELTTPPSQMKPADRIAELESAGVKTVNGKPLAEANSAELINAVGKLRRGQLEEGAVAPTAPKTLVPQKKKRGVERAWMTSDDELDPNSPAALRFENDTATPDGTLARISEAEQILNRPEERGGSGALKLLPRRIVPDGAGGVGVGGESLRSAETAGTRNERFRRAVSAVFGKNVVFVEPSRPVDWSSFVLPNRPDTIFVNTQARVPLMALTGHEMAHTMSVDRPDLYKVLESAVAQDNPMPEAYRAEKAKAYTDPMREWVADQLGTRMDESDLWDAVAKKAKQDGKLAEMSKWVGNWLRNLADKARNLLHEAVGLRLVKNLDEMRSAMADVLTDYAEGSTKRQEPTAGVKDVELSTPTDIIDRLKSKKKIKPGMVSTPDPYTIAHDAAIDIAILAIRAGRKVAEVMKLATDRFKARYPKATPEEVARMQASIQAAMDRPPMPPSDSGKTKPSALPESLKEVGAPVESIEYKTRNQEARKAEAADIVRKQGAVKAEELLDSNIPGDTRVAIGGELIRAKMFDLLNAKGEDVGKLTRDIQRITAKMQPELATEAGQTIAMFKGIYDDIAVASGMEQMREAQKKRDRKLGGKDAVDAATDATKELKDAKTPAEVARAIENLKRRHTTKPARKVLDVFSKRIEKILNLKAIGALDREDLLDLAAKDLGIESPDPAKMKVISEIAERIKKAKNKAERAKAEIEMIDQLDVYKGKSAIDALTSAYTANILSGPTTQGANIEGNTFNTLANLGITAATNPKNIDALVKGLETGIPLGWDEAKSIWRTGRSTRDFQDKTGGAGSILSTIDVSRDFPSVPKPVGAVATKTARALDRVFRFMKAADAVFYYPAREAKARLVATKLLEADYSGAELKQKVSELLQTTPEAFESAKKQAIAEGFGEEDLGRRIADIIEERRTQTPEGTQAVKESEQYAADTTFTNEPVGLAGAIYHGLKYATEEMKVGGVPLLKPFALFLKTPTNVFNTITNWTPMGNVRAETGVRGPQMRNPEWKNFTKAERAELHLKGLIGTTLMATLLARVMNDKDDLDITAKGPDPQSQAAMRKAWQQAGGIPYSIKIGNTRVSYRDTPLVLPLAIVGHVADSLRYSKAKSDMMLGSRIADAIGSAPSVIFDMSMLTGLSALMESASGQASGKAAVGRTLESMPANVLIPFNRALQQIDQAFDPKVYKNPPVAGSVPFLRRTGEAQSDIQGRPQTYSPSVRFASSESKDPVDTVLREKRIYIPEVSKDTRLDRPVMTVQEQERRAKLGAPVPEIGDRPVMSDDEREKFRQLSGQRIRVRLQSILPMLRTMKQGDAQKEINRVAEEERNLLRPRIGLGR
jgi:hypothetical protein